MSLAVCSTTYGGEQKGQGQSDGRIVPMKMGNAIGGKPRGTVPRSPAMQGHIAKDTLSMRRNGDYNGNETGKNITDI